MTFTGQLRGRPALDLTGQRYGQLTVLERVPSAPGHVRWRCSCSCGNETEVAASDLRKKTGTKSCGCLVGRNSSHGMARTPTYASWSAARDRCYNPRVTGYERYGGRGIRMCERWSDFSAFLEDMGERPEGTTLDRIDSDGDYEPGNCRWADRVTQNQNRKTRGGWFPVEVDGVVYPTLAHAGRALGVAPTTVKHRAQSGVLGYKLLGGGNVSS